MDSRETGQIALEALWGEPVANPADLAEMLRAEQVLEWTKVDEFATNDDFRALQAAGLDECKCRKDPMDLCPVHACSSSSTSCGSNVLVADTNGYAPFAP